MPRFSSMKANGTPRHLRTPTMHKRVPPNPLAILTKAELESVNAARIEMDRQMFILNLMDRGKNAVWMGISKRHGLPEDFDFDFATGKVFKKGVLVKKGG